MLRILPIIAIMLVSAPIISLAGAELETGVEIGQWAEYRIDISSGGDESMSEYVDSIVDGVKKQFNESGFDLDKTISIRYTVASISGDLVTFDRTVKIAPDSQTKEKFRLQSFGKIFHPENMIDKALLDSIRVEKLESVRYDLTEFSPTGFFIMPTNLEFGSKFEGETGLGEITFYSISDQRGDRKSNLFTAHDVAEQDVRSGVVTNTLEFDNIGEWEFDRESGILVGTILDMEITNWNTYESGWVSIGISRLDSSDDLKQKNIQRYHHSRPEILERLSYLFVEYDDSRYLLTNQVDSVGKPAKTTFDIINRKDNSEIGGVILHGDNLITSVTSFTVFTGSHTSDANDIHTMIRQSLLPECCGNLPTHNALFSDTIDEKYASVKEWVGGSLVNLEWSEFDSAFEVNDFRQEISYEARANPTATQRTVYPVPIADSEEIDQTSDVNLDKETDVSHIVIALGLFIIFGIPGIIVGLIVWKIRQRRKKRNQI